MCQKVEASVDRLRTVNLAAKVVLLTYWPRSRMVRAEEAALPGSAFESVDRLAGLAGLMRSDPVPLTEPARWDEVRGCQEV